jgi:cytochrome b pre-mRNA-processing protein 3
LQNLLDFCRVDIAIRTYYAVARLCLSALGHASWLPSEQQLATLVVAPSDICKATVNEVMIFGLFRGNAHRKLIGRLHGEIVAAARDPVLFTRYGIADTLDGRFESIVLHAALVLRRLEALPPSGPDIAQELTDALFKHFDIALREIGIADTRVPKQMKALAEAFFGRAMAYHAALEQGRLALSQALSRNVYAGRGDGDHLACYVMRLDAALSAATLPQFLAGPIPFAKPAEEDEEAPK